MAQKTQIVSVNESPREEAKKLPDAQGFQGVVKAPEVLLRKPKVLEIIGLSNSTFYARIRDGSIKPGVPLGPRIKAWPVSEIQSYIQSCIAARNSGGLQ
ncbi:putative DNA-binding transcriptional regulator AlpA [Variovorax sp. GrIS 2.14]|uniref:helix-turn-helix transcriptional regulator n=1 Tax=Variovorax sp. GrIS 2.14 TaxID=3071709 RepID=UPI0038F7B3AD